MRSAERQPRPGADRRGAVRDSAAGAVPDAACGNLPATDQRRSAHAAQAADDAEPVPRGAGQPVVPGRAAGRVSA